MRKILKNTLAILTVLALVFSMGIVSFAEATNTDEAVRATYSSYIQSKAAYTMPTITTALNTNGRRPLIMFEMTPAQVQKASSADSIKLELTMTRFSATSPITLELYPVPDATQKTELSAVLKNGGVQDTTNAWTYGNDNYLKTATVSANGEKVVFDVADYVKSQTDGVLIFKIISSVSSDNRIAAHSATSNYPIISMHFLDEGVSADADSISIPNTVSEDFTLPVTGANGSTISWTSSDSTKIAIDGANATVTRPSVQEGNATVSLTALVSNGTDSTTRNINVTIIAEQAVSADETKVEATADTYVSKNSPDRSYSTDNYLFCNGSGRHNFISFNVADATKCTEALSAKLNFYVTDKEDNASLSLYGLEGTEKTAWFEDGFTYADASTAGLLTTTSPYGNGVGCGTNGSADITAGEWLSIDITNYVKTQTDGVLSFRFYGGVSAKIASRETENAPYIELFSGDTGSVMADADALNIDTVVKGDFTLPIIGTNGASISWTSDNSIISIDGANATAQGVTTDQTATLTATVTKGTQSETKEFSVLIPASLFVFNDGSADITTIATDMAVTASLVSGYTAPVGAVLYMAAFDAADNMINAVSGQTPLTISADTSYIKAYLWDAASLKPIDMAATRYR